jgi:hypothetical protein
MKRKDTQELQQSPQKKLPYSQEQYSQDASRYETLWKLFRTEVSNAVKKASIECPQNSYPRTYAVCQDIKKSLEQGKNFSEDAGYIETLSELPQKDHYIASNSALSTALKKQLETYTKNQAWIQQFETYHSQKLGKDKQEQEKILKGEREKQIAQEQKQKEAETEERKRLQETLNLLNSSLQSSNANQKKMEEKMQEVLQQNILVLQNNAELTQQVESMLKENQELKDKIVFLTGTHTPNNKVAQQTTAFTSDQEKTAILRFGGKENAIKILELSKEAAKTQKVQPLLDVLKAAINKLVESKRPGAVKAMIELFDKNAQYFPVIPEVVQFLQTTYLLQKENQNEYKI